MTAIVCNARIMGLPMCGVQRVSGEILCRLKDSVVQIAPRRPLSGWRGHLWEQAVLPIHARGRLLWSPSATGPLSVARQVITIHDVAVLDHPEFFSAEFARFYSGLLPRLARRARHVITVSQFSKQRIVDRLGTPAAKVSVVPNGVTETFRPFPAEASAATARKLGVPAPRYVLAQATSDRRKNLGRIVEAWTAIAAQVPDDIWLVVTGSQGRAHIFGEGEQVHGPRICHLGFVSEDHLPPLTAGALAFVYPSLYEGFGLPVLEAMAAGVPVITSDIASIREVAGDAATVVSPLSTPEIASAILQVVMSAERRDRQRQAGFENARRFSWDRAAQQTLQILERFVPRGARN
jgi:glycosyltransferase involved in cell wall biosynthesis